MCQSNDYTWPPTLTNTPAPEPTATITACTNHVLNSGFEGTDGWSISPTEYPARYVNFPRFSGNHSMQIGIVNRGDNRAAFSSIRQTVFLPANNGNVSLGFWLYAVSTETLVGNDPSQLDLFSANEDRQVVILNPSGNQEVLVYQRNNNQVWTYYEFDLTTYAGQVVELYFGSINDGLGGVTGMFVDEVILQSCP